LAVIEESNAPALVDANVVHFDVEVHNSVVVLLLHMLQQAEHDALGQQLVHGVGVRLLRLTLRRRGAQPHAEERRGPLHARVRPVRRRRARAAAERRR
jgi:hypothetical protein